MRPLLPTPPLDSHLQTLIQLAVNEDMGIPPSDLTVNLAIPADQISTATIVARKPGTLAGLFLLAPILAHYTPNAKIETLTHDASPVIPNQPLAKITAPDRALLSAERVCLNFLSHLSGIATLTAQYVAAVSHLPNPPAITDTRKTTPAFRTLDKYAVLCGGGGNHRMNLHDGVMLKDNHLAALRNQLGKNLSLAQLTVHIRKQLDPKITLWLEVDNLGQLIDALGTSSRPSGTGGADILILDIPGGADIILLDNFTPDQLRKAVAFRNTALSTQHSQNCRPLLESSGGITLATLPEIAATGIDRISIGALTHSAPILDLSMELN